MTAEQVAERVAYYDAHDRCPHCGGNNLGTTTLGCGVGFFPGATDTNRATCCDCKWSGTVHDLAPKGT